MKVKCPKCGLEGYLIIDRRQLKSREQVYYFVLHRFGKRVKKCSIGAEEYINVTKTHTLPAAGIEMRFSNVAEIERLTKLALEALENLLEAVKRNGEVEKVAEEIEKIVAKAEELRRVVQERKSVEKQ